MRKLVLGVAILLAATSLFVPSRSFTEDGDTLQLARVLYALGKSESYETKLALGTVVMNRIADPWFPDTLSGVLAEQQQFPAGSRYDEESLRAAHAVLTGARRLPGDALYYRAIDAALPWDRADRVASSGGYDFFAQAAYL